MVSIVISDRNRLFREFIKYWVAREQIAEVVADMAGESGLLELAGTNKIDLVVFDFTMPVSESLDVIRNLIKRSPSTNVLLLTNFVNPAICEEIISAGIKGCLLKDSGLRELAIAIHEVSLGRIWFSNEMLQQVMVSMDVKQKLSREIVLTDRELEILKLICQGYTTSQISQQVFLSYDSVKWHRSNILAKTGCINTISLLKYAMVHKIVNLQELDI